MRALGVVVAALLFASSAGAATNNDWRDAQIGLAYQLFEPSDSLGLREVGFTTAFLNWTFSADFGFGSSPNGFGVARGFELNEGSPGFVSSRAYGIAALGTRQINGVRASVSVYCSPPSTPCSFAEGARTGYFVRWLQPSVSGFAYRTQVELSTSRLTFAEVLRIAESLRPVRPSPSSAHADALFVYAFSLAIHNHVPARDTAERDVRRRMSACHPRLGAIPGRAQWMVDLTVDYLVRLRRSQLATPAYRWFADTVAARLAPRRSRSAALARYLGEVEVATAEREKFARHDLGVCTLMLRWKARRWSRQFDVGAQILSGSGVSLARVRSVFSDFLRNREALEGLGLDYYQVSSLEDVLLFPF